MHICLLNMLSHGFFAQYAHVERREGEKKREEEERERKSGIEIECCSISIHSRAGIAAVGL